MAKTLDKYLNENVFYGIEFVFFDGEEAFVRWTSTDSLYGSRHLANKWSNEYLNVSYSTDQIKKINNIQFMLLLDLLGSKNPQIFDYYPNSSKYFQILIEIQNKLRKYNL